MPGSAYPRRVTWTRVLLPDVSVQFVVGLVITLQAQTQTSRAVAYLTR